MKQALDVIERRMATGAPFDVVLRLFCLYSVTQNGLPASSFDQFRDMILQVCFAHLEPIISFSLKLLQNILLKGVWLRTRFHTGRSQQMWSVLGPIFQSSETAKICKYSKNNATRGGP